MHRDWAAQTAADSDSDSGAIVLQYLAPIAMQGRGVQQMAEYLIMQLNRFVKRQVRMWYWRRNADDRHGRFVRLELHLRGRRQNRSFIGGRTAVRIVAQSFARCDQLLAGRSHRLVQLQRRMPAALLPLQRGRLPEQLRYPRTAGEDALVVEEQVWSVGAHHIGSQ